MLHEPDLGYDLRRGCAKQVCDQLQLVHHIPAWEQRLPQQDLSKDAAYAPDVNGRAVLGKEGAAQLGGAIPARGHIVCPEDGGRHVIEGRPCQAKVADFELAV